MLNIVNKKGLLTILFCLILYLINGQNDIDYNINKTKQKQTITKKVDFYIKLGDYYRTDRQLLDSALYYYNHAIINTNDTVKAKYVAFLINSVGINYAYKLNLYNKAMQCFVKSLLIFDKLHDLNGISTCYTNIGNIFSYQKEYSKSLNYYYKALELCKLTKNKKTVVSCLLNIGQVYSDINKYEKALYFFKHALNISNKIDYVECSALLYDNVGTVYFKQGDNETNKFNALAKYNDALNSFAKSLKLYKANNNVQGEALVLYDISSVYLKLNHIDKAKLYADSSLSIATKHNLLKIQSDNFKNLADIYDKKNNYQSAYKYYKLFKQTNDSIYNIEKSKEINSLYIRYETEKKETEIANQNIKINLLEKQKEVEKYKIVILFIVIIMFFVFSFSFFIYIIKKNKTAKILYEQNIKIIKTEKLLAETELNNQRLKGIQLQNELKYKNQEIINLALHITERNEFLKKIKNELIKNDNKLDNKELIRFIDYNLIAIDKEKKEFESHIENISKSFYIKLRELFPDITKTEERLAALLKLNLSSKEISSIFNISIKSVEMSRYRLRKKLNLNKDESLTDVLNNI